MKVLHIVPSYLPAIRYGGPIYSVHSLNKWLVKLGVDVTVYTTNADGAENLDVPLGREVNLDGIKVFYFPLGAFRGWFYSKELKEAIKNNIKDFDLVHITSVFLSASTLGAHYAKKFNKPYVISPRGSLMSAPLRKGAFKKKLYLGLVEKKNLKNASAIHFTVSAEKDEYLKNGLPMRKSIIVPNGLDMVEFPADFPKGIFRKRYNIGNNQKVILFLSRISWKKGLDVLIPAFADVAKKENCVLAIVGGDDEGYKKVVEAEIKKFSIEEKVIFTGMLSGEEKLSAYADASIFVLPSYAENFGNVVLEAMAMSLPVVVSPDVGLASIVKEKDCGLVVKRNSSELSTTILELLGNEKLRNEMGARGRLAVENDFAWQKVAEKFISEYEKLKF